MKVKGQWKLMGVTEMVKDNLSPRFKKCIVCPYRFEERQIGLFKVLEREPRFSCEAKACSANISDKHICDKN